MLIVGLNGGIGSGKSMACAMFAECQVPVIDADKIAHDLVAPGQAASTEIRQTFGSALFTPSGHLDRKKMRELAFSDTAKLASLETILHPKVRREIQRQIAQLTADYVIVCVPLLLEKKYNALIHRVLVIDSREDLQRQRVLERDRINGSAVDAIIQRQMSRHARLRLADDVIDNNGSMGDLRRQVRQLHVKYQTLAAQL